MGYSQLAIGITHLGLQVWCLRHKCNVVHYDFKGQNLPHNINQKDEQ